MDHGQGGDSTQSGESGLEYFIGEEFEDRQGHGDAIESVKRVASKKRSFRMIEGPDGKVHIEGIVCVAVMSHEGRDGAKQTESPEP